VTWMARAMHRFPALARTPLAYGWVTETPIGDDLLRRWIEPALTDRDIRRDLLAFIATADKRYTLEAARALPGSARPVLLAWARRDRFFPMAHAERLAALLPDARLVTHESAQTFVALDQPDWLAGEMDGFIAATAARAAA